MAEKKKTTKKKAAKKKATVRTVRAKPKAKKKVSRQREWQRKMREEGRCIKCGAPAVGKALCPTHLAAERERQRKLKGWKGRKTGALSYQFE